MKILVFGNVGSGKTTVLRKLHEKFPFDVIAIDDFRRKFGDGSKELEAIAKEKFLEQITENKNQFIECIGVGRLADELYELLYATQDVVICLTLHTPKNICETRLSNRIWDIPFPNPIENVPSLIERTEVRIEANDISTKWSKRRNTHLFSRVNIQPSDIDQIASELYVFLQKNQIIVPDIDDIKLMLSKSIQDYYGNEYLNYQKHVIERNDKFLEDRLMISDFLSEIYLHGTIADIGSGNCQWFHLFESHIDKYYAIDANNKALLSAPQSDKLSVVNKNIFDICFNLKQDVASKIDFALFSFFFSHFSNKSLRLVLDMLSDVNSIIIIDSLWSERHKSLSRTKNLEEVKRSISSLEHITLPKRFFDYSDIENLVLPMGFSIVKFLQGNYWFACFCVKK